MKMDGFKMMDKEDDDEDDFEAENAANTIMKADKYKEDPELMEKVHAYVGRKMKALTGFKKIKSIKDIKEIKNKKFGPKAEE